jgi:serine/threonine protein kinase/DNA-binding winged helix-turn-helix (wHTH) protein
MESGVVHPLYRFRFENVEFDEARMELRVDGELRAIEPRPLELLAEFVHRPGEAVSRQELLEVLWNGRPGVPNILANAVKKLRDALGPLGAARVITLPRVGYRFDGPVAREAVGRSAPTAALALQPGQPLPGREDSYRLETRLGRSTRHAVWRASHLGLKICRVFKFAADGDQLAALKRELTLSRYLAATLGPRPDLATVHDANFAVEPYFLEFDDLGVDLHEWAAQDDRLAHMPRAQRLALFLQIARTVADTHSLGVLHKDIKPSNVIVRREGAEWRTALVDFGSGRLLDRDQLDRFDLSALGLTVSNVLNSEATTQGTFHYIAPELLEGQPPTIRSDVYALGLLLFQLLVGDLRKPMSTGWQRAIDDDLLVADVTAATEGQAADRLASVGELISRITRLEERRATARGEQQMREQVAQASAALQRAKLRKPWLQALVGSLALGLAGVLIFYWRSTLALDQAQQQAARAESIIEFLTQDLFKAADLTQPGSRPPRSATDVLLRAADNVEQRFKGQPETEAQIRQHLALALSRQSTFDRADREFQRSIALYVGLVQPSDPRLVKLRLSYANLLTDAYRLESAREQLGLAQQSGEPAFAADRSLAASLHAALANYHLRAGDKQEAQAQALAHLALLGTQAALPVEQRHRAMLDIAYVLSRTGEHDRANALYAQATESPFDSRSIGAYRMAYAKLRHAYLMIEAGDERRAEAYLTDALTAYQPAQGASRVLEYHLRTAQGFLHEMKGDFDRAQRAYADAYEFGIKYGNEGVREAQQAYLKSLYMRVQRGDAATVVTELQKLRTGYHEAPPSARSPFFMRAMTDLHIAQALSDLGSYQEALGFLDKLTADDLQSEETAFIWAGRLKAERARALMGAGRLAEGKALMQEALQDLHAERAPAWAQVRYAALLKGTATAP